MKHPRTDAAMQAYVSSCGGDKDSELQKFREQETQPHPIAAHRYRPLVAAALIILVIGISVLSLTLPTSLLGIRHTSLVVFPQDSFFLDSLEPSCRLNALINKLPEDVQPFLDISLPQLKCTTIEISRMTEKWGSKSTIGLCVDMESIGSIVYHITGYYLSDDHNLREFREYHNFSQQILWQDNNIYYRIKENASCTTYQLYFQDKGTACYMNVEATQTQNITDLLNIIFKTH